MDREAIALNDISKSLKETNRLLKSITTSLDRLEKKTLMSWTCTDEAGYVRERTVEPPFVVEYSENHDITGSTYSTENRTS